MPQTRVPNLRGEFGRDVPLRSLNSWRVGGSAEQLFRPADLEDLCEFLRSGLVREPLTWLGLGSNVLIRDGGISGTVVAAYGGLSRLERAGGRGLRAEAGVPCAKVARAAARWGLGGIEFLVGIPGTVGGALAMNAGAFGGETWSRVGQVQTVDRLGRLHKRAPGDFTIGYRSVSSGREEWFVAAEWVLPPADSDSTVSELKSLLSRRADSQPTGVASCGSVFRNPPGDHAGRLIEICGLKGFRIGGAAVSEKHANFIVNTGSATAADLEALILHIQNVVATRCGVQLAPEVRILGRTDGPCQ